MNDWNEGALALLVVLAVGIGLFLFADGDLGGNGGTETPAEPIVADPEAAARGEILAEAQGCLQCHTPDGTPASGPTWKGVAGSERPLVSGEKVIADDAYLFNSIVDPHSQVVEGYDTIMPTFYEDELDETQINDLVEYIKSLA